VRTVERPAAPPRHTLDVPDAVMMIADTLVILDNLFGRAIVRGERRSAAARGTGGAAATV